MFDAYFFLSNFLLIRNTTTLRTGQILFLQLPIGAQSAIVGYNIDPYYKDMTWREIKNWVFDHLVFDHGDVIAVIDNDNFIWTFDGQ